MHMELLVVGKKFISREGTILNQEHYRLYATSILRGRIYSLLTTDEMSLKRQIHLVSSKST